MMILSPIDVNWSIYLKKQCFVLVVFVFFFIVLYLRNAVKSCLILLVAMMRPIFCGNFEYDARQSDLERLFRRYGKVDRVDMKSGKLACSPNIIRLWFC